MNMPELCIRRPVMTILLTSAIIIFGWVAYKSLPISELPRVDFPVITVTTALPGANPETMADTVALPLERQFSTIPGLVSMNSNSGLGTTQITLIFALERNIDAAAQDVQSSIDAAQQFLPTNLPHPPIYRKVNPADLPIIYIGMSSETLPISTVNSYADNYLSPRLSTVSGVAQVSIYGAQKYAVRIQVNPEKLATTGISLEEVEKAIQDNNVNLPTGVVNTDAQSFIINIKGQLENAAAYLPLVVAYRNGSPIRLQEIATVIDSVENHYVASWINQNRGVILAIQRQPGTNTVEIADRIHEILPSFSTILPKSIKLEVIYDRSVLIKESIDDVKHTLLIAMFLVILVIFVFIKNMTATFISSMALPVSVVGTFAGMYLLNYSLDNLSLLALVLSIGFVVDDAIVMLENIVRHLEKGETPIQAALMGSKEIGFTIVSMTLSLIAVFIPVLFMSGLIGRLLREFSVTICLAILISGLTALTLTPMLCSLMFKIRKKEHLPENNPSSDFGQLFKWMYRIYDKSLTKALKHQTFVLWVFVGTLFLSIVLYVFIPKGFLPSDDLNQVIGFTEGDRDFSFENMARHQQEITSIIAENPNVEAYLSVVGAGGTRVSNNSGFVFMRLTPRAKRSKNADKIIQDLREQLQNIVGIKIYLQNPPSIRIGGQLTKAQYQYTLQDTDYEALKKWADIYKNKFKEIPGFYDVTTDMDVDTPNVTLTVNRDRAATLGVSMKTIENALGSAFGTKQISTIYTSENQYVVILEADETFQKNILNLSSLYVATGNGKLTPLSELVTLEKGVQALTISHLGQLPSATISFNLAPNMALGTAVEKINALEKILNPPNSLLRSFQGTAQTFQASLEGFVYLLIVAILTIYIVLGILYESFIHPLTILSGIPSAGVGALLTLMLFGLDLNLYAFTGVIMLIGIVKKNAIMMVDFAITNQNERGLDPQTAIYQACLVRFRPIMMTTFAALMGILPIAIGMGAGAGARQTLGIAVVGGLLVSQVLTLYITPAVYLYLEKYNENLNKKFAFKNEKNVIE